MFYTIFRPFASDYLCLCINMYTHMYIYSTAGDVGAGDFGDFEVFGSISGESTTGHAACSGDFPINIWASLSIHRHALFTHIWIVA